jgi:hypothetical protein
MRRSILLLLSLFFSSNAFAQQNEVLVVPVDLSYERNAANILEQIGIWRTTPQGVAVTRAICAYYGVPPEVVDFSTENFWRPLTEAVQAENDFHGIVRSPPGYEICTVQRQGEISITGGSSITVSIWRENQHGLGWTGAVPQPGFLAGNEFARAHYLVTFVRNDLWNKYVSRCTPSNVSIPSIWNIDECDHGPNNCRGLYQYR